MSRTVVTICGSMRFYRKMLEYAQELSDRGFIVLMPFMSADEAVNKDSLEFLHRDRIAMSDTIFVVNEDDYIYIGESTHREIAIARAMGKTIIYASDHSLCGCTEMMPHLKCRLGRNLYVAMKRDGIRLWNQEGTKEQADISLNAWHDHIESMKTRRDDQ